MKRQALYSLFLLALCCSSCKPQHFYQDFKTVDVKQWNSTDTLRYSVDIDDSTAMYDLSLSIRHQKSYEFSNLWLDVAEEFGAEKKSVRFEVPLFRNDGKPYGKGSGSLCTQTMPFQHLLRFPGKGKFNISIVQLMRKDPLDGISDVGVIMDKVQK